MSVVSTAEEFFLIDRKAFDDNENANGEQKSFLTRTNLGMSVSTRRTDAEEGRK